MSFYLLLAGVRKKLDIYKARLVWQAEEDKKKYHLVNKKNCCLPNQQGGLGITNLENFNIALLAKWIWKLEDEVEIWQYIIKT